MWRNFIFYHIIKNDGFFRKQLVIPSNLTMLSVEQEVDGDETEVVQAVLESDSRRTDMLAREKQLHEIVNRYLMDCLGIPG